MKGKKVSHYEVADKLGDGAKGEVYRARDLDLKRTVALKFMRRELLGSDAERSRFFQEAQAAAALEHPNIATIYEVGGTDAHPFIAMAYVDGRNLLDVIVERPLKMGDVLDIGIQMAEALQAAHDKGIVHRDIKSANVMLTPAGRVKVMDFGCALTPGTQRLTKTDRTVGTVAYMSPEQARASTVDHRSDIWSLGVVIYEMSTGRLPFQADHEQATLYTITHNDPKPPSSHRTVVPAGLDHVVLKALSRDPDERYQRAGDLAQDLRRIRAGITTGEMPVFVDPEEPPKMDAARTTDTSAKTGGPPGRHAFLTKRAPWVALVAVAGIIIAALVLSPSTTIPFGERDWVLITSFDNQTGERIFDGIISRALAIDLDQSRYVNVYPRQRVLETLRRMGRDETTRIDEDLGREIALREGIKAVITGSIGKAGEGYILSATIRDPLSGSAVQTESVHAADPGAVLTAIDHLSKHVRKDLGESLAAIDANDVPLAKVTTSSLDALKYYTAAYDLQMKARWDEAIPLYESAIAEDSSFAIAWSKLAVIANNMGNTEESLAYSARALELAGRVTDRERYYIEAEYYRYRADLEKAIERYKALTQLYPDDFSGHNNLAFTLQFTRDYEEALVHAREVVRITPDSWYPYHNTAGIYAGMGRYAEALESADRALAINPRGYWTYIVKAWSYWCMGDSAAAFEALSALPDNVSEWQSLGAVHFAQLYRYTGEDSRAIEFLKRGVEIDALASRPTPRAVKWAMIGQIRLGTGDGEPAIQDLEQAVYVLESSYSLSNLAVGLGATGRFDRADLVLERLAAQAEREQTQTGFAYLELARGKVALARGDHAAAVRYLEVAKSMRDWLDTRYALGRAYREAQRYDEAVAEFAYIIDRQYAAFFETSAELWPLAHYELGLTYDAMGKAGEAVKSYRTFLAIWRNADSGKPEIAITTTRLKAL